MKKIPWNDGWLFRADGGPGRTVDLPHDALQELGREKGAKTGKGGAYFRTGVFEYTKFFDVPAQWEGKEVIVELEGVYPNADVFLNGVPAGKCAYGYAGYRFPLKNLNCGEKNELKVSADASQVPDSRWYAGAGIYRPVRLWIGERDHIAPNGIRVTTLSTNPAAILAETDISGSANSVGVEVRYEGKTVASGTGASCELTIPSARLWDADNPNLYECAVTLIKDGRVVDEAVTTFGIRQLAWSRKGFFVNGKNTLLRGGCIHSDNGILGARTYAESEWRRIEKLKEFGFNAVRIAHNPACEYLLEACDALGMYVLDEAWDMW